MHGACRVLAAETMTVRRSVMSAPATGFGGRCPPPARCPGSSAGSWGIERGAQHPLAEGAGPRQEAIALCESLAGRPREISSRSPAG